MIDDSRRRRRGRRREILIAGHLAPTLLSTAIVA